MSLHFLLKIPLVSNWLVFCKKHPKVCSESMLSTVRGSMGFSCSVVSLLPSLPVKVFVIHLLLNLHPQVSHVCPLFLCPSPSTVELGGTTKLNAGKELSQYMSRIC